MTFAHMSAPHPVPEEQALRPVPGENHWRERIVGSSLPSSLQLGNSKLGGIAAAVDPEGKIATFTGPADAA